MQQRPIRARLATALYRRTSLPFRAFFVVLAYLRSDHPPKCLAEKRSDAYLAAHTKEDLRELWKYGYHRVYDLVRNFQPPQDPVALEVLSIGPRTEIELYYLWLLSGFSWDRIVGADIVSNSSKIKLSDMSVRLEFNDNSFDVIVASGCLEKSRNPEKTRDEIRRVAKPGATVLVSGNRLTKEAKIKRERSQSLMPVLFFNEGVYGLIQLYQIELSDIQYMNALSPHGFEIIFKIRK